MNNEFTIEATRVDREKAIDSSLVRMAILNVDSSIDNNWVVLGASNL